MDNMKAPVGKLEMQLKQLGAKLDELVSEAEEAGEEAKIDYRKRIDFLKSKFQAAQSKLDELKTAGSDKWETFKVDIESTWNELQDAFEELTH